MKTYTLFISALAAMLAVSCTKGEQGADTPGAVGSEYIKVSVSIASSSTSRAIVKDPAALTGISFVHAQLASEPAAGSPVSFADKVPFTGDKAATGGAITFAPGSEPKYDKTPTKLISYLMGYHPAGTPGTNQVSWTPDGATDILLTNLWKAGTYLVPATSGMKFDHALSRIEVKTKYAASTPEAAVAQTWGQLKGIAFKNAPKTITFDYATNAMTSAADLANFALLNGATYTTGAFTPVDITATADVVASAMIPPTGADNFTLIVTTEHQSDVEIPVTLDAGTFDPGKIHVVTLEFNAKDKTIKATATTITDWNTGVHGEEGVNPPTPKIGDYYYSDNSYSPTFDNGKTLLGVVYRVNPDGTGMMVEVTEAPDIEWAINLITTRAASEDSGVANTNTIKGLDPTLTNYPAFKYCDDKNTDGVTLWYLPASKEMRALHAGISGLRWVASGANPANGEIDDWEDSGSMSGNDTYAAARAAFNTKMTAAGGINIAVSYWSATEFSSSFNYALGFSVTRGKMTPAIKSITNYKARCVRAF